MAQTAARIDPLPRLQLPRRNRQQTLASFSEVSGLTADGDMVEYREGTDGANTCASRRACARFANITLKAGVHHEHQRYGTGTRRGDRRRELAAQRHDRPAGRHPRRRRLLSFHQRLHQQDHGPDFKAAGNEVAIESAEIWHEGLTIKLAK